MPISKVMWAVLQRLQSNVHSRLKRIKSYKVYRASHKTIASTFVDISAVCADFSAEFYTSIHFIANACYNISENDEIVQF